MKTQSLTIEQINSNLKGLIETRCFDVLNEVIYLERHSTIIAVYRKKIYVQADAETKQSYLDYCKESELHTVEIRLQGTDYIPFDNYIIPKMQYMYWNPKHLTKHVREYQDSILIACGIKKAKESIETDLQLVRRIGGTTYAEIYKLIQNVKVIKAEMIDKKTTYKGYLEYNYTNVLGVMHETGSFCFPIHNVVDNVKEQTDLQNAFFTLLGLPISTRLLEDQELELAA